VVAAPALPFLPVCWAARCPGAAPEGVARVATCLAYLAARDIALIATGREDVVGRAAAARAAGVAEAGSLMGCLVVEATALLTGRGVAPAHSHAQVPEPRRASPLSAPVLADAVSDPGGPDQMDSDGPAWAAVSAEGSAWRETAGAAAGPSWPPRGRAWKLPSLPRGWVRG
jgi:hypothetical protein